MHKIAHNLSPRWLTRQFSRRFSTKPVIKEETVKENFMKDYERITNIAQKHRKKLPQRAPFLKNFYMGIVDTEILAYPQLTNEELSNLDKSYVQSKALVDEGHFNDMQLSSSFLHKLGKARLLGLQTAQLMGGREYIASELCKFTELMSELPLRNNWINNENLGVRVLSQFGSDKQKKKYLERLVNGDLISAFCVLESSTSGATLSSDGKSWVVSGKMGHVINGSDADVFIVITTTGAALPHNQAKNLYTAFIIDRDFGGVLSTKHHLIDPNLSLADVEFCDTLVPYDNIIGLEHNAEGILKYLQPEHRLSTGVVCSVLTRNLIDETVKHYLQISEPPNYLYETDQIQISIAKMVASLYAMESMIYLTSGLIDKYENQDTVLEATVLKVFASNQTLANTTACLNLIGPDVNVKDHWCNKIHREAMYQATLNDGNEDLKILIALLGFQHAGTLLQEIVTKMRNPLFYATHALKLMWTNRHRVNDNQRLSLLLKNYVHPSCAEASDALEYCVLRLQFATEVMLGRYGQEVISKHADLQRIADSVIDIYAMTAAVTRASRSYCIGLAHSDFEVMIATVLCLEMREKVRQNLQKVIEGPYSTNDHNYKHIAEKLFTVKQYYPVHPLSRNF